MHVYIFMRNGLEFKCNARPHPLFTAATASTQYGIIEISNEDSEDDSEEDIKEDSEEDNEEDSEEDSEDESEEDSDEDSEDDSEEDNEEDSEDDSEEDNLAMNMNVILPTQNEPRFIYGLDKNYFKYKVNISIDFARNHVGVERKRLYIYSTEKRTYWRCEYVPRNNARGVMKKARIEIGWIQFVTVHNLKKTESVEFIMTANEATYVLFFAIIRRPN
ncbi:uncharacterized protein LOC131176942 [Hevea brasiliensis]|uniref:uncharacterized protein LOC131176942 n=1 Tax=Hevea brasiliensis TaxID=3981 RepID=UPI0025DC9E0D|nr:uncharacterized protein LOC131176942 [Hevea brasiliensis]